MSDARVRVPCSTSNLGAGFDCVGVALDRWLDASVRVTEASTITIAHAGTGAALRVDPERDHLLTGFRLACAMAGAQPPAGLAFEVRSAIPVARGLGSSAAALVAGALLADAALGLSLAADNVVGLVAALEGHPDNAAPIVLGGAVLAVPNPGTGYSLVPLEMDPALGIALAIPDFETATRDMRAALPAEVPHRDAVVAAGKAAALVRGLATGDPALLAYALDDVLHVPYRRALVRGYDEVVAAAREAGAFGATLSGSGSTVLALAPVDRAAAAAGAMREAWEALGIAAEGSVARVAGPAQVV